MVLKQAKEAAIYFRVLTGKPLGITDEVAEYEAAWILGLELAEARQPGFDAIRREGTKNIRIQIKGRRIPRDVKLGQRLGSIRFNHMWDSVVLVLLDEDFEPYEMYEAKRGAIKRAITRPGSGNPRKPRNYA